MADPPLKVIPPDSYFFPEGVLGGLRLTIAGRMSRPLLGNVQIEPSSFRCPVVYTNVLTGETSRYTLDQLPVNMGSVVPGQFYFMLHPLRYYYCDGRQGGLIRWHLIESFQNGQLIRGTFTQETQYGAYYIPVRDRAIIRRLEGRLRDYLSASGRAMPRPGFRTPRQCKASAPPKKSRRPRRR